MRALRLLGTLVSAALLPAAAAALPLTFSAGSSLTVVGGYAQTTLSAEFDVINTGTRPLSVGVVRQEISSVVNTENNVCFGACYPPSVGLVPAVPIASGATEHFIGDYTPSGVAGVAVIRYAFYDANGTGSVTDTAYVTVTFDATQRVTGRASELASSPLLAAPAPNPAPAGSDILVTLAPEAPRTGTLRLVDLRDGRAIRATPFNEPGSFCVVLYPEEPVIPCGTGDDDDDDDDHDDGDHDDDDSSGGCFPPTIPPTAPVVRLSTNGLAAGVYGLQLVDSRGRVRAMRRLVVQ